MMERRWAGMVSNHEIDERYAADVGIMVDRIETPGAIAPGDVVRLGEGSPRVSVLYRRGSNSNTLLATERCNSFCVMCSQPPRDVDDAWLVGEMIDTIPLIDRAEVQLGISGGEADAAWRRFAGGLASSPATPPGNRASHSVQRPAVFGRGLHAVRLRRQASGSDVGNSRLFRLS